MRKVVVEAGDLSRVLSQAVLFAGSDETLPMLCTVKLTVKDGRLWAASTDRFAVGVADCPVEYDGEPFAVLIRSSRAKVIAREAKPKRSERGSKIVDLLFEDAGVRASVSLFGQVEAISIASYVDYDYPKVHHLFENLGVSGMVETSAPMGLRGEFMERIGKAVKLSDSGTGHWYTKSAVSPVIVRSVGLSILQMPVRQPEPGDPAWGSSLADGLLDAAAVDVSKLNPDDGA